MPIFYPDILDQVTEPELFSYTDKDVMLYALSIGLGADPLNEAELPFVYEKDLKVVPTAVTVLAPPLSRLKPAQRKPGHRESVPNALMLVHGEQKIELHRPLPTTGSFTVQVRTIAAFDKGKEKGAVEIRETTWTDAQGDRVATLTSSVFLRGDGGFDGPTDGAPAPHAIPDRAPDLSISISTRPDQALLYRLNGDRNPLHSDPASAGKSGFPRPILHGLCTYGITCRAVLEAITDFDADQILSHQVRFSAPVFPGETIVVDLWRDGKQISFEARVAERNVTVIKNGLTVLR
ncbi:Acyl dehydratase [Sphingobium sp. AP50]|uniref:MaoC/PaaZ C-terminal domain-containing protein n=1 Tax=Sphingobium sp. AP50 TaxID=1884369 RepID=UPI0008C6B0AC|nr:MaoC/PaaZ C-terminal domain-containing protein [Sphingobium sp. AP50]SEK05724.1 Acyl dehydratase [Sphingobium sp. AP50]